MKTWIWQRPGWPALTWDNDVLIYLLAETRHLQGKLTGTLSSLGFSLRSEASLITLTGDVIKSSDIEGRKLDMMQVRSSLARRLGLEMPGLTASSPDVDGMVDVMLDATRNCRKPLTQERLCSWQSALFPSGRSGMYRIITGRYRDDSTGPMQVVSGALGKEKIHYQAPPAKNLVREMNLFLEWFNKDSGEDLLLKAGLAHFRFVTIHPFEDGNGRLARAIADMLLSRSDNLPQRFYSMSSQIRRERKEYYAVLERSQKGTPDVTEWLKWFLTCLRNAIISSENTLDSVLLKHSFRDKISSVSLNERQILMIDKLLDNFDGKLTTSKWARINKCSSDTALRDIQDLIDKKILEKEPAGGRSTCYRLVREYDDTTVRKPRQAIGDR